MSRHVRKYIFDNDVPFVETARHTEGDLVARISGTAGNPIASSKPHTTTYLLYGQELVKQFPLSQTV